MEFTSYHVQHKPVQITYNKLQRLNVLYPHVGVTFDSTTIYPMTLKKLSESVGTGVIVKLDIKKNQ